MLEARPPRRTSVVSRSVGVIASALAGLLAAAPVLFVAYQIAVRIFDERLNQALTPAQDAFMFAAIVASLLIGGATTCATAPALAAPTRGALIGFLMLLLTAALQFYWLVEVEVTCCS